MKIKGDVERKRSQGNGQGIAYLALADQKEVTQKKKTKWKIGKINKKWNKNSSPDWSAVRSGFMYFTMKKKKKDEMRYRKKTS